MANGNPFYVDPTGGVNIGAQLSGLGHQLQNIGVQKESQRRYDAEQQKIDDDNAERLSDMQALQEAYKTRDYDAIARIAIRRPEMGQAVRESLKAKDERTEQNAIDSSFDILQNPERAQEIIQKRIDMLTKEGADPSDTQELLEMFKTDPEGALENVKENLVYADSERWLKYSEAMQAGKPKPLTQYQEQTLSLEKQRLELRKQEAENTKLKNAIAQEDNIIKRNKMKLELEEKQEKLNATKKTAQDKLIKSREDSQQLITSSKDTIKLIGDIENHPGFESYIGAKGFSSAFGLFDEPVAGTDAAGVAGMVETLTSQNFLDQIQNMKGMGALSNAEGQKVSAAVTSLNPNMSEADFKKALNVIRTNMTRAISKAQGQLKRLGVDESQQQQGQTYTSNSGVQFTVK